MNEMCLYSHELAVSRGELERDDGALGATLRTAGVCVGTGGSTGVNGTLTALGVTAVRAGRVGGICRGLQPDKNITDPFKSLHSVAKYFK